jgi:alpha-tubulin suppressor-like RCC1 family protein
MSSIYRLRARAVAAAASVLASLGVVFAAVSPGIVMTPVGAAIDRLFVAGFESVDPPVIVSQAPRAAVVDVPYTYRLQAMDPYGDPVAYALAEAAPGMQIDPLSGLVQWLPQAEGAFAALAQARSTHGGVATQAWSVEVLPAGTPAPVFVSEPPHTATVGTTYRYVPDVEGHGQALAFAFEHAPQGMQLDALTGAVTWVPSAEGAAPVTLTAAAANGLSTEQVWTVDVAPGAATIAVGGTLAGLKGGTITLRETRSGQTRTLSKDGPFAFALNDGASYEIVVATQPVTPEQVCWVENGFGSVAGSPVTGVVAGCHPSTGAVEPLVEEAQEAFDADLPPTTTAELEASEFGQNQLAVRTQHVEARAHALAMAAIDPDPEWFATRIDRSFVVASAGDVLEFAVDKLDLQGNVLDPVPADQLRFTVRIQRADDTFDWLPAEFASDVVAWQGAGRVRVQVPANLVRGRLLVGLRPNLADIGQRALSERWSTSLSIEVWPRKAGVTPVDASTVLFPMAGAQRLARGAAFPAAELLRRLTAALDAGDVYLPLVLTQAVTVGELVDYRVDGRPYGGRVVSVEARDGQWLAMVEPAWMDIYDVAAAPDGFLVSEGVLPETVVYRSGPAIPGADAAYRGDLQTLDGEVKVVAEGEWAPLARRARGLAESDAHALFIGGCDTSSGSLTFTPKISMSPLDVGVDIKVGASGVGVKCKWRSSNDAVSFNFLRTAGPLGLLASSLAGSEVKLRPYGEVSFGSAVEGLLVPGLSGFQVGLSTASGVAFKLGLPLDASEMNDLVNGTPIVMKGDAGVAGGIEAIANLTSPTGLIGWLVSTLGGVDTTIGLSARASIGVGVVLEGANAKAVHANNKDSRGAVVSEFKATLDASDVLKRIAGMLGGNGNIGLSYSVQKEVLRFAGEYEAASMQDDGRGSAHVGRLVALPSLAAFLGLTPTGRMGPRDTSSSVFGDNANAISYEPDECAASSDGTIRAPVVACVGMFCGKTNEVPICGGQLWVDSLAGDGKINTTVQANGTVGVGASAGGVTEPFVPVVLGDPLVPSPDVVVVAPGETKSITGSATCGGSAGVRQGRVTVRDSGAGQEADALNLLTCRGKDDLPEPDRIWGSPHLVTADGFAYDYYASGDYVLQRVPGVEGLEVQARFLPGLGVSWPQAVALKVGTDIVEIHGGKGDVTASFGESHFLDIRVNGTRPAARSGWHAFKYRRYIDLPGGGVVLIDQMLGRLGGSLLDPIAVTVAWPQQGAFAGYGIKVSGIAFNQENAYSYRDAPPVLDIRLLRPPGHAGEERGLLGVNSGNASQDLTRRNGERIPYASGLSWTALYALFGADWLVRPDECLFANGCIEPQFPTSPVVLDPAQQQVAEIACSGLEGWYREACIHDVGLTGVPALVQNLYANTADLNAMADRIVRPGIDVPVYTLDVGAPQMTGFVEHRTVSVTPVAGAGEYLLLARPPRGTTVRFASSGLDAVRGTSALADVVAVSCLPDPQWRALGSDWPSEGSIELWALDPLSGAAHVRLARATLPAERVTRYCVQIDAVVDVAMAQSANVLLSSTAAQTIVATLIPAPGIVLATPALAPHTICAGCSVVVDTGYACPAGRVDLATLELRDAAGTLHEARSLACEVVSSVVTKTLSAGMWSGFGIAESLLVTSEPALWNVSRRGTGRPDLTRRDGAYPGTIHAGLVARGIAQVAAGERHSVALLRNGEVWAWGYNGEGQLGDGTLTTREAPVRVGAAVLDRPVTSIAVGRFHNLALDAGGRLWAWGGNVYGHLGDGTTTTRPTPVLVDVSSLGGKAIKAVAAGRFFNFLVDEDGRLWAWGDNGYGQLGDGTTTQRTRPVPVDRSAIGTTPIVFVSAGDGHAIAVDQDGKAYSWGTNSRGELGNGASGSAQARWRIPARVQFPPLGGARIRWVLASNGGSFSLASDSDGRLWSWGSNDAGQLGIGDGPLRESPTPIDLAFLGDARVAAASVGGGNVFLIDDTARLWAWGTNRYGELGDGTYVHRSSPVPIGVLGSGGTRAQVQAFDTPTRVVARPGEAPVVAKAIIERREFVTGGGRVTVEGSGLAFAGAAEPREAPADNFTRTLSGVTAAATSICPDVGTFDVDVALRAPDGTSLADARVPVHCVPDVEARLERTLSTVGVRVRNRTLVPFTVRVRGIDGVAFGGEAVVSRAVCAGCEEAIAVDQRCPALGARTLAEVEVLAVDGEIIDRQPLDCGRGDRFVGTGGLSSQALTSTGTLWAWGHAIGLANYPNGSRQPVRIEQPPFAGVPRLYSGIGRHVGIGAPDGTLWGWGPNHYGQLGNGNHFSYASNGVPGFVSNQITPVAASGPLSARALRDFRTGSGFEFSVGIDAGDVLWAWGSNGEGNLGDTTRVDQPYAVPVGVPMHAARLAVGYDHAMALSRDGLRLWGWGDNNFGQLGNEDNDYDQYPDYWEHQPPLELDWRTVSDVPLRDIAAAGWTTYGLDAEGRVWAWGRNGYEYGLLGNASTGEQRAMPGLVDLTALGGAKVTGIAAATYTAMAVDEQGRFWAWGANGTGLFGTGTQVGARVAAPVDLSALAGVRIVDAALGDEHIVVLDEQGRYWAWGTNSQGQVGTGDGTQQVLAPRRIEGLVH